MTKARISFFVLAAMVAALIVGEALRSAGAWGQSGAQAPTFTPQSPNVAAGEDAAKRLLVLMDADKSGTVSRQEFMAFMTAEFDRLDKNKDNVLDVRELEQSQLAPVRRGGTRR